jgi:hypothetical protein
MQSLLATTTLALQQEQNRDGIHQYNRSAHDQVKEFNDYVANAIVSDERHKGTQPMP